MTTQDELYSPRFWSKRYGPEEIIEHHVAFVTEGSRRNKENIDCRLNVSYGESAKEKIDIFGTDLPNDSPIFIWIHGGYWQMLDRSVSSYMVEPLHKVKIKVMVIGYDLCPTVTLPEIVDQVRNAYDFCISYAKGIGSRGICIGGHSAGAHLVASLFTSVTPVDISLLKEILLVSGVFDLIPLVITEVNKPLKLDIQSAREISPQHKIVTSLPKCTVRVVVGEHESPAFIQQSEEFAKKLKDTGIVTEYLLVHDKDHFDIVEDLSKSDYTLVKFIVEALK